MKILRLLLLPAALLYGIVTAFRNLLFDIGILPSQEYKTPLISVGNLAVGGTGKTPHVEYLINLLKSNKNIAVLSRGYGRNSSGTFVAQLNSNSAQIGDELRQIKQKFKNEITVIAEGNRKKGMAFIAKKYPEVNTVLLDDGYQHRYVKPGLSILLTQYNKLYIDDYMLPAGNLREWRIGSKRADIIIITKTPAFLSPIDRRMIIKDLKPKQHQKVYFSYYKYGDFVPWKSSRNKSYPSKEFYFERNFSILVVTGIANASKLIDFLKKNNENIEHLEYADHHNFSINDIDTIRQKFDTIAASNKIILTTEKDVMRLDLPGLVDSIKDLPFFYVPIEVKIHQEDENEFNKKIIEYVRSN